ncbi:MAG: hypothetical protein AB8F95_08620 [Bacteroidia bacterium]
MRQIIHLILILLFCCIEMAAHAQTTKSGKATFFDQHMKRVTRKSTYMRYMLTANRGWNGPYIIFHPDGGVFLKGVLRDGIPRRYHDAMWDEHGVPILEVVKNEEGKVIGNITYRASDTVFTEVDIDYDMVKSTTRNMDGSHIERTRNYRHRCDSIFHYHPGGAIAKITVMTIEDTVVKRRRYIPILEAYGIIKEDSAMPRFSILQTWDPAGKTLYQNGVGVDVEYWYDKKGMSSPYVKKCSKTIVQGVYHGPYTFFNKAEQALFSGNYQHGQISDSVWVHDEKTGKPTFLYNLSDWADRGLFVSTYSKQAEAFLPLFAKEPSPLNMDQVVAQIGYPILAVEMKREGIYEVRVRLNKDGSYNTHYATRFTHKEFMQAVERHIHEIKFSSHYDSFHTSGFIVNVPFSFKLVGY